MRISLLFNWKKGDAELPRKLHTHGTGEDADRVWAWICICCFMHRHPNGNLQIEGKNSPLKNNQKFFNDHKKDILISCCVWLIALCSKAETFNPYSSSAHMDTPEGRGFSCLIHRGKCSCHQDVNPGQGNPAFNSLLNPSKAPGRLLSTSLITLFKPTEKKTPFCLQELLPW